MAEAKMQRMMGGQGELFPPLSGLPLELPEEAKRGVCSVLADLMMGIMRAKSAEATTEADSQESVDE